VVDTEVCEPLLKLDWDCDVAGIFARRDAHLRSLLSYSTAGVLRATALASVAIVLQKAETTKDKL